ncbi:la protein 1 [Tasmannia lanceolata]|uniref:la protein 1 n=1 Tax=Tasmannia lanceolata TaxID=3420 RepID=UPI00406373A6
MAIASLDEETAKNVLRQVEFYFSDSNLPRDNFLKKSIDESEDGLVSLALICSFSRMRNHLNLGTIKSEDVSDETVSSVAETLRKSSLLKLSEDGKRIGRSTEIQKLEEVIEQVDIRTIAASPLEYDVKLEDLESFFGQYGKVNSVRLPRHVSDKKYFCGTALIEFSTEEDAKNVLEQSLVYAGADLELKPKKEFDSERGKMEQFDKSCSNNKKGPHMNESYPRGLIVAFKLKSMSKEGSTEHDSTSQEIENVNVNKVEDNPDSTKNVTEAEQMDSENVKGIEDKSADVERENGGKAATDDIEGKVTENVIQESSEKAIEDAIQEKEEKETIHEEMPSATNNTHNEEVISREDLKCVFQKFGIVKYVDYSKGEESGYIRFEQPEAAQKARAAAVLLEEGGLIVNNYIAFLEAVTGDAERDYWSLLRGNQERHRGNNKGYRGRGGNTRGGRHFSGKHQRSKGSDNFDQRPNKAQKLH